MGKIFCLMGKSASGKDTIYKELLKRNSLSLSTIVPCTTRPIRQGEKNGVEYFFYTEEQLQELEKQGKIIEMRQYNTVYGVWKYFTADDGQIDLNRNNYILIGTLEAYLELRRYYGEDVVVPLYIDLDDGERLSRALARERQQENPKYAEMCRRFLADQQDFSPEKFREAGYVKTFYNEEVSHTVVEIEKYVQDIL